MRTLTTVLVVSLPSVISAFQGTCHLSASRSLFDTNEAKGAAVCYHGRRDNGVRCLSGRSSHSRVFRPRHHRLGAAQQPSGDNSIGAGLEEITVEIKGGIKSIRKEDWDSLLRPEDSPFLEHDWIYSMEETNCATIDTGWQPQHLAVKRSKGSPGLMAAVPLYVKYHSQGEFIFDQSWAEASYRAGMPYYPKLLVGVPFTPAEGARVLIDPSLTPDTMKNIRKAVGVFLRKLAQDNNISSVHVNFCTEDEVEAFTSVGFLHRKGLQYHWRNRDRSSSSSSSSSGGYEGKETLARRADGEAAGAAEKYRDFDSYLGNFASKRRIKIRRERRSVYDDAGVNVTAYRGDEITDSMLEEAFLIYKSTIDKMIYGRLYLTSDFFKELARRFKRNIVLILAEKNGKVIAGTFNVVKAGRFYGRYWGAFETVKNLHFETCYYKAIEFCIENGLDVMEPGAGGGDFKFLRGFDPAIINSCHFCIHPGLGGAVDNFLMEERQSIDEAEEYLMAKSALANRTSSSGGGKGGRSSEDTATVRSRAEERSP